MPDLQESRGQGTIKTSFTTNSNVRSISPHAFVNNEVIETRETRQTNLLPTLKSQSQAFI